MELYTYPPIKAGQLGHLSPLALLHHPSKAWGVLYVRTVHERNLHRLAPAAYGCCRNASPVEFVRDAAKGRDAGSMYLGMAGPRSAAGHRARRPGLVSPSP
jgi:hypothetical protein